jgi:hypothetical protein
MWTPPKCEGAEISGIFGSAAVRGFQRSLEDAAQLLKAEMKQARYTMTRLTSLGILAVAEQATVEAAAPHAKHARLDPERQGIAPPFGEQPLPNAEPREKSWVLEPHFAMLPHSSCLSGGCYPALPTL